MSNYCICLSDNRERMTEEAKENLIKLFEDVLCEIEESYSNVPELSYLSSDYV